MKAAPFTYHAPTTLSEAIGLLGEFGDEAKVLAGGQSLLPMLAYRLLAPAHIVDIGRVAELSGHRVDGETLVVRAGASQRELERSADVAVTVPVLQEAIANIAHAQIRNRGTICGSLAHADPAAELPTTMVALGATMIIEGPAGRREVPAEEFFEFHLTSVLNPDELLVEVRIPVSTPGSSAAFLEISRRKGDFALVGVMAALTFDDEGRVERSRIVCSGVAPTPYRATDAEEAIATTALADDALLDAQGLTGRGMPATDDIHATAEYRRHVAGVLVRRCLARIRAQQGGSHG